MRLLNTETKALHEFMDGSIPPYAILSHRWGADEVSLQDYEAGRLRTGAGYKKIMKCCDFARSRKQAWVWIDTCCIDKKSSAELTEAINSMFAWYHEAQECYAYLVDVQASSHHHDEARFWKQFAESAWFKRGWTLQELIAPKFVYFLAADWRPFGCKHATPYHLATHEPIDTRMYARWETTRLNGHITRITGIPDLALGDPHYIKHCSVAQRMSWAAGRETSRVEDRAYSLLGLFGVNMPLLYGERVNAFYRLQREILSRYDDDSLFAWRDPPPLIELDAPSQNGAQGILTSSPRLFKDSGAMSRSVPGTRAPYNFTNRGLELRLKADDPGLKVLSQDGQLVAFRLKCDNPASPWDTPALLLRCMACSHWARIEMNRWTNLEAVRSGRSLAQDTTFYVHTSGEELAACLMSNPHNS